MTYIIEYRDFWEFWRPGCKTTKKTSFLKSFAEFQVRLSMFLRSFLSRCEASELPFLVVLSQISFDGRTAEKI